MKEKEPRIIQIIPAAGWYAVYGEGTPAEERSPLACWALTSDGEVIGQVPIENCIDNAEDFNNFSRYRHESERPSTEQDSQLTEEELAAKRAYEEEAVAAAEKALGL
ncbi:DUF6253 family protein [Geomonas ferrireducens]|uniref:DUF6253 family protein n=1 Tax=Geomonas ferrireducens TaxID=2570227 RepID=UPI0010A8AD37|nr:DUF6253 family protein [Geomonas ferrireducens]